MRIHPLSLALLAVIAIPVHASDDDSTHAVDDGTKAFERVVVIATRTERAIVDVPNTVDEIDRERMDELLVNDLKDLFRYEPGVTVGSSFGRFNMRKYDAGNSTCPPDHKSH